MNTILNTHLSPTERMFYQQMFGAGWIAPGVAAAAELGLADLLVNGPETPEKLAELTPSNSTALHRLLRALAAEGSLPPTHRDNSH